MCFNISHVKINYLPKTVFTAPAVLLNAGVNKLKWVFDPGLEEAPGETPVDKI